jgi:hypothetical protein
MHTVALNQQRNCSCSATLKSNKLSKLSKVCAEADTLKIEAMPGNLCAAQLSNTSARFFYKKRKFFNCL